MLLRAKFKFITLLLISSTSILRAGTLENIQKKGQLSCGVSQGLAGFSAPDAKGQWAGFDVDFCKALAASILGDPSKVRYVPLSAKERFTALQSGEIDVLSRNTSWTLSRDTKLGFDFAGVSYYDGQGFMVKKSLGIKSAKELDGATICVNSGTTTELNLADYFRAHNLKYKLVAIEKNDEVVNAYEAGRCDAITTDQSGLFADRTKLKKPDDHMVLPEIISKEPLGPVVRHGDNKWADIVRWTLYALVEAEELGINSKNIDSMSRSKNPTILRFMGKEGDAGKNLGLKNDWTVQIIKHVGNYSEIFERNLGMATALKIPRGKNDLWTKGGLQYPMPIR